MNGGSQNDRHRGPGGIGAVGTLTGDLDVPRTDGPGPGAGTDRDEPQDPDDDQRDPHQSPQKGPATAHGAGCRLWVVPISTLTFGDVAGSGTTSEPRLLVSHRLPIHLPQGRPAPQACGHRFTTLPTTPCTVPSPLACPTGTESPSSHPTQRTSRALTGSPWNDLG